MGGLFPKAPAQPSMEEQYAMQKKIQDQASSEAAAKSEEERRKASLERQRAEAKRRGSTSLITPRSGGLFGTTEESGIGVGTSGTEYQSLYKQD